MATIQVQSGFKSSEFYITLINNAVGIAVVLGYLTPAQADDFVKAVVSIIGSVVIIISTVAYIWSRLNLKAAAVKSSSVAPVLPVTKQLQNFGVDDARGKMVPA